MKAIIDFDLIKYQASSAGEKRTIKAIHRITGIEFDCKTRTEFWGHYKKKDGGLLAVFNKTQGKQLLPDEFDIVDIQTPEPIANVLHTVKMMTDGLLRDVNATSYHGYLGKGTSFREDRSTMLKYKGNRENTLRPLALEDVSEFIIRKYNPDVVEHLEADDWCTIDAYRDKSKVIITSDKDADGTDCLVYNPNRAKEGVVDCGGFGKLWLDNKGKVRGKGRLWFYMQLQGDSADNYKCNALSDVAWGEKAMYNALKDCKNDKEALTVVRDVFKMLYPEPKLVTGWRGEQFMIDWKYAFDELFDMARMLRWEGDVVVGTEVLDKFGLLED